MYRKRPQLYNWVESDGHNHPHGPPDFETPDYTGEPNVRLLHGEPVGGAVSRSKVGTATRARKKK
jgi:hypothetical protein